MRGTPAKKTHHPHTGIRWPFCPECLSAQAWRSISQRNLGRASNNRRYSRDSHCGLSDMENPGKMVRGVKKW